MLKLMVMFCNELIGNFFLLDAPTFGAKLIDVVFTERQSRSTKMNNVSSRSHCITTLFLSKILIDENDRRRKFVSQTQMQFVDLSGSERTSKTGVSGKEQIQGSIQGIEGIVINIDLWALGTV